MQEIKIENLKLKIECKCGTEVILSHKANDATRCPTCTKLLLIDTENSNIQLFNSFVESTKKENDAGNKISIILKEEEK